MKVVAHTLKGMLSNLAVAKAANSAAKLEQIAAGTSTDSLTSAMAEFENDVDGLLTEMETYVDKVQSLGRR